MSLNLIYALEKDTNQLVHIKDVQNGLQCNCYCPECNQPLIAKNGGNENLKNYHFSHNGKSKCSSSETYLHFISKVVFSEITDIHIPESGFLPQKDYFDFSFEDKNIYFGKKYKILDCTIENNITINGAFIRPDLFITLEIDGVPIQFLIEIAVTHFIDEQKEKYIQAHKLNCIEINLQDLKDSEQLWDKNFIKTQLSNSNRIKWINQSVYNNLSNIFFENHQNKLIQTVSTLVNIFEKQKLEFSNYNKESLSNIIEKQFHIPINFHRPNFHNNIQYFVAKKAKYFFKYDNPIIYLENENNDKFCIIFKEDKNLIEKINKQKIDILYLKINDVKLIERLYPYLQEVIRNEYIPLPNYILSKLSLNFIPYNRYNVEKNKYIDLLVGKEILVQELIEMQVYSPKANFFIEEEKPRTFIVKHVEIDKYIQLISDTNEIIYIVLNNKIKSLENKNNKCAKISIYYEHDLSLEKIKLMFNKIYRPHTVLKSDFKNLFKEYTGKDIIDLYHNHISSNSNNIINYSKLNLIQNKNSL